MSSKVDQQVKIPIQSCLPRERETLPCYLHVGAEVLKKPHPPQRQKKPRQNDTEETRDQEKPSKPSSFLQEPQEITNFGLPADLGNFENSDFSLELKMSDFIPVPEVSFFDNVGHCIPLKLKQKIWGGQFIDLSLLLKSAKDIHDSLGGQGEIKIQDGKVCIVKSNSGSYLTIEKWTNAFIIIPVSCWRNIALGSRVF